MLSVFLDSNIFYTDPFLDKNIYNKLLIELSEKELITIYISDVVQQEIVNNFEKELIKHYEAIKKSEAKIKEMLPSHIDSPICWEISVEEYINKLERRFEELQDYGCLEIIPYSNDMLPQLVERSIKRKKPFSESKMEFRDAIIWFSYVDYVKNHHFVKSPVYFITKNTEDFMLNGEIHPDLQQDSSDFILYKTPQDFFQDCLEVKQFTKTLELINWVENQDFPNHSDDVLSLIDGKWYEQLLDECVQYVYDHQNYIPTKYPCDADDIEVNDVTLDTADDINVEVILDTVIITGFVVVHIGFEVFVDNIRYEPGDDEYLYVGSDELALAADFTLKINQKKQIEGLDVVNIQVL